MLGERGTWGVYSDGQRRCLTLPNGPVRAGSCGSEYCRRQCGHILDLHSAKPPDFCKWLPNFPVLLRSGLTRRCREVRLQRTTGESNSSTLNRKGGRKGHTPPARLVGTIRIPLGSGLVKCLRRAFLRCMICFHLPAPGSEVSDSTPAPIPLLRDQKTFSAGPCSFSW